SIVLICQPLQHRPTDLFVPSHNPRQRGQRRLPNSIVLICQPLQHRPTDLPVRIDPMTQGDHRPPTNGRTAAQSYPPKGNPLLCREISCPRGAPVEGFPSFQGLSISHGSHKVIPRSGTALPKTLGGDTPDSPSHRSHRFQESFLNSGYFRQADPQALQETTQVPLAIQELRHLFKGF